MLNDFYSFFHTNHEWTYYKKQVERFYLYDFFNFPMKTTAYDRLYKYNSTFYTLSGDF